LLASRAVGELAMTTLLAFDTATERMTVALRHRGRIVSRAGEGGAQASATLLPAIFDALAEAGLALADVDAIAFGRGPGAFTGLRTACSVAQGLAFGAAKTVLPLSSLLAVAEDARVECGFEGPVWAVIDARMDQVYAAQYQYEPASDRWSTLDAPFLTSCEALAGRWRDGSPRAVAGNAIGIFGARLETAAARLAPAASSSAIALLRLAERDWADGLAVDPALALPVYVRDHVADTIVERQAMRAGRAAKGGADDRSRPGPPSARRDGEAGDVAAALNS
jgi:tRNA threonylcarbamoyladenosine biosynthesis protein TsaB